MQQISGGSRGGALGARASPLFLEPTEAWRDEKMFFWDELSPSYQGLDDRPPPPLIRMSGSATADSKVNIFLVDTFDVSDKLLTFMD